MTRCPFQISLIVIAAAVVGANPVAAEPTVNQPAPEAESQTQPPKDTSGTDNQPAGQTAAGPNVLQSPQASQPISKEDMISVLGKQVRGPNGEIMGRVLDLLLDRNAQPRALVIDFGGFLGVGSRKIAIDWKLVHFEPNNVDAPIALDMNKDQVQAAPEYKETELPPVMVGPVPSAGNAFR